jgi:hypothetical protein
LRRSTITLLDVVQRMDNNVVDLKAKEKGTDETG